MNQPAVRVENLTKCYRLGTRARYGTLRESLSGAVTGLLKNHPQKKGKMLWALEGVSFEIQKGETVGIIGRNSAGKSTLLKILSRITEPTRGRAELYSRVGSLLEVGSGFHRELTGRENIYLNGAILGMKKSEIDRKFDEIVSFAEVEDALDTPVKHYSSGMYVRLAFAVAAYLDPGILLVDEVLAVGDVRFQKKCLNKMQSVGEQGRTVLFVSHQMTAITRLCQRTLLLDAGKLIKDGPTAAVVSSYMSSGLGTTAAREWKDPREAPLGPAARFLAVRVRNESGEIADVLDIRKPVLLELEYEVLRAGYILLPHYHLYNQDGVHIFSTHDLDPAWRQKPRPCGRWISSVCIPGNLLSEGMVFVSSAVISLNPIIPQFYERDVVAFQIVDSLNGDSARGDWAGQMQGAVRPLLTWSNRFYAA